MQQSVEVSTNLTALLRAAVSALRRRPNEAAGVLLSQFRAAACFSSRRCLARSALHLSTTSSSSHFGLVQPQRWQN